MVRSIWAVACTLFALGVLFAVGGGCASTKSQMADFSRMDVGDGPGSTLRRLTELQKDGGSQQAVSHPEQKTSVLPPSGTLSTSDKNLPPTAGSTKVVDTKPAPSRDVVPSTRIATKPSSAPAKDSSGPSHPTSGGTSSKETVLSEVSPTKLSEPSWKEVPASTVPSRIDDAVNNPPITSKLPPPTGASSRDIPVEGGIPMAGTKTAEATIPSPQASAGKMPRAGPPPSSIASTVSSSAGPQYRIGPEDVLHISVWGNEELTMDVIVRPDGKISIPLIQDIQAEGLTASELADRIHEQLLPFIKDPNVSVIVRQINASKFSVIGYVNRPGTFPLRGDVTVLQALSEAGGFTPFASPRKIKIIRNADGKKDIRVINYYDMIEKGDEGIYLLKPGDTIVVP